MRISKDNQTEVVVRQALWIVIIAWLLLPLGLWFLGIVLVGRGGEWVPTLVCGGVILVFLGVGLAWMTTRICFNQPPGHITVTRGYIPLFFWFLRRKVVSKEEAKSAQSDIQMTGGGQYSERIKCEVKVRTSAGRSVTLFSHSSLNTKGGLAEIAEHVARRIREFG